jgi:hypothetical protein
VGATTDFTMGGGQTFICHECGGYMILDNKHVSNNYRKCEHCETVGEITTDGGEEWCGSCGLDPSEEIDTYRLSVLWKEGSEIRRIMNEGKSGLGAGKSVGDFLRNFCGPHCNFADKCDQTVKNLVVCHKEYKLNESESEMSKKSRERRKEERARARPNTYKEKPKQTMVQCAKSGWFERHIVNGTYHTKQSGDKES